MNLNKPRCLVIGANGFIGSHLVDSLAGEGYRVRAFDTFVIKPRFNNSGLVEIIKGETFDTLLLKKVLKNVDYVFHSISATTPFTSDNDPYTDINKNLFHNVEIIENAVRSGIKKMVFISSGGAVYGNVSERRQAKETDAPQPVSPYGINKLATEYYLEYFNRKYGLKYVVYRLTNPYGPRQITHRQQGVVPSFLNKIQKGQELTIYGDGNASRDYIFISDVIQMITGSFYKNNNHSIYNLGSGKQTDLNTIVKTIEKIVGKKARLRHIDAPKTFLKRAMVSNARFKKEFGAATMTGLETGIRTMLDKK